MILNYFHESFVVKKWQIRNLEIFISSSNNLSDSQKNLRIPKENKR